MSKKANPTSIGLFIVIGLALGVGGLLMFSSSRLFTRTVKCVVYFNSSLNGLNEGAPVKYRGVTIGSVHRVMIRFNQSATDTAMPVIIELQDNLIRERMVGASNLKNVDNVGEEVRKGLRATLATESIVTGVLYVSLEMITNAPPAEYHQETPIYFEIPSRPTEIQQLMKNLASMDIAGLGEKIGALITRIDTVVGNLNMREITDSVTNVLTTINRVASSPDLTNSLAGLKTTLDQYRLLAEKVNSRVDPLADGVTNTLAQASQTLVQVRGGMQNLRDLLAPDSSLRHDLTLALDQLAGAAQSISALTEFLRNHPNALIAGRKAPEKKP